MKKKLLFPCLLLIATMLLTCLFAFGASAEATVSMTDVAAGTTTPAAGDIVTISNEAELQAFSKYVSDGGATEGITFRLESDIALTVNPVKYQGQYLTNLNPIGGVYNGATEVQAFKGIFDGNGKTISNLVITNKYVDSTGAKKSTTKDMTDYCGLFATIDGGTVKDLTVKINQIVQVGTNGAYGAITGYATNATISNTMVLAEDETATQIDITKNTSTAIAGLVGSAKSSVIDGCTVKITVKGYAVVAAIVGTAEDTAIRNCVAGGTYSNHTTAGTVLGGIAGELTGVSTAANCYSSAALSGQSTLGGIVGVVGADATVENCFSDATVSTGVTSTGVALKSGTLVGINNGTVKHSFGLRAADKGRFDAHADIGENLGAVEEIYAFMVKTEGDVTSFVVGTVTVTPTELHCSPEISAASSCTEEEIASGCAACGGTGYLKVTLYEFVPAEDGAIANLADALNAWVAENSTADVAYANWVVNGATIVNCKHTTTKYVAYEGKAPDCIHEGEGDMLCAFCDKLIEEGVTIPATPDAHTSPDGKYYTCVAYDCVVCKTHVEASQDHTIDAAFPCKDQTCTRCHNLIKGSVAHTKPEDFDESKPCAEYTCTTCSTKTHDVEHTAPDVIAPCQDSICEVCGHVAHAGNGQHVAGLAPTCTRGQFCMECGLQLNPPRGHAWGDPATCGSAQICTVCEEENPDAPATGEHTPDKEDATCTEHQYCLVCENILHYAKGHTLPTGVDVDCGTGKSCTVCYTVLESATGDHSVDWSEATVIRPATPTRTGIIEATCYDCGRVIEGYITCSVTDKKAYVTITVDGEECYFSTDVTADVVLGKVASVKDVTFAEGYVALQAIAVDLYDGYGEAASLDCKANVSLVLNNSAKEMASDKLKLYAVNGTTATEITGFTVADGYINFETSAVGTFVIAGEEAAAFETLGTVTPKTQKAVLAVPYTKEDEI